MRAAARGILLGAVAFGALGAVANEAKVPGCTVKLVSVDAQNVPTFRGECAWSVAPAFVAAVLTDPARLGASSSLLIASDRLADGRIVNVQKTGWPFEDRQSTIEVKDAPLADGGVERQYKLAEQQVTPREGAVQVGVDEGSWRVTAAPEGASAVLEMRYEPGGNLPTRIVQTMSPKYIAKGLDELRVAAEKLARENPNLPAVAAGPPEN
ncbi:MAG: hypothetical protein FJ091_21660 [Deltaproteobacteria bacterium]|nr:hypothetical protein [Deltaproteobacteria bacterium]